jgi:hypothetical protein
MYGQFTDYAPHPEIPGAYNFQTTGGNPYTFAGPEAEQLKARLDAANQATTVAGDNAAPGFNAQAAAAELTGQSPPPPGVAPIQGAPPPTAAPPGMVPYSPENGIDTGTYKNAAGQLVERVAGTKGTSVADLKKRAAEGVATPTAESKTVSGGFEQSQEYKDDMAKAYADQQKAIEEKRDAEITAQEQGRAIAGQQFEQQTVQLQQQQALAAQVQAHVDQAQATRDQALQDYSNTKIDPQRIFSGTAGAFKGIAAALAAGAGAYGAAINHTQNFAQQAIDNVINRDIMAQEAALRTKKDTADNALSDLVRRGMSLEQAKGTLATIQRGWAAQQLQLAQGATGTDQINANADKMQADLQQKMAQENETYRQKSLGQATQAVQSQILHPVAGSAGGLRLLAPGQARALVGQVTENQAKVAGTAKVLSDIGSGGKRGQGEQRATAAIATANTALKSLDAYGEDAIPQTPENQDIASSTYHYFKDKTLGAGSSARDMPEHERHLIQDTEAARGYVKSLTSVLSGQGALSGPESAAADKGLAPGATVGDIKRAVAILKTRAQGIIDAGGSVDMPGDVPQQ